MASGNADGLGYKMVTQDSNLASTDSGRDSGASLPCPYSNSQSAPMRNDNNAPPGALEPTIRLSGGNSSNTPETDADTLPLRETKCALSGVLSVRNFCNNRSDSSNRSVSKMPRSLYVLQSVIDSSSRDVLPMVLQ